MSHLFPPITGLLPHRGAMCLLDSIRSAGDEAIVCELTVRDTGPFHDPADGRVPAWVGIEYIAQASAVCFGLRGGGAQRGVMVAVRSFTSEVEAFTPGQVLSVHASLGFRMGAASIWDGRIHDARDEALLVEASLSLVVTGEGG
jgi:predicted hotdog family 3-hydroxylacyl-ACP dehydratase